MKVLVITVAGTATRFNRDTEKDTLKCLYYKESPRFSLLYQILDKARDIDKVIIVGGYLYNELLAFTDSHLTEFSNQIELVYNSYYKEYGSGYSLIKGIECIPNTASEVLFVEGDLFFDASSFGAVKNASRDVVTVNREFITAQKAVALYVDDRNHVCYVYDTKHDLLIIPSPIKAIYNSAQVWKFMSLHKLKEVIEGLTMKQLQGTNLEIIQTYFDDFTCEHLDIVSLENWFNCNTVADYNNVYSLINNERYK